MGQTFGSMRPAQEHFSVPHHSDSHLNDTAHFCEAARASDSQRDAPTGQSQATG